MGGEVRYFLIVVEDHRQHIVGNVLRAVAIYIGNGYPPRTGRRNVHVVVAAAEHSDPAAAVQTRDHASAHVCADLREDHIGLCAEPFQIVLERNTGAFNAAVRKRLSQKCRFHAVIRPLIVNDPKERLVFHRDNLLFSPSTTIIPSVYRLF